MSTRDKPYSKYLPNDPSRTRSKTRHVPKKTLPRSPQGNLFRRLDIRFPWLKLIAALIVGGFILADILDLTISRTGEAASYIKTAPMARHAKATERSLEGKKLVALTFDDGPSPETTPRLLEILTEKDATATFFMLGNMARNNPDIVKQVEKCHYEIASHTMYHQNLVRLTPEAAKADLDESKAVFKGIIGHGPAYVRPPYGNYNASVAASATRPLILWSVDTEDWANKNTDAIIATTMSEVHDGAVILMHDIYPTSVEAVAPLIDTLRADGYELATISELAGARGIELSPGEAYYNFRP